MDQEKITERTQSNHTVTLAEAFVFKTNNSISLPMPVQFVTAYIKKRGFLGLGKRETYIDAYSLNPNSRITGLNDLMVLKERQKRFGLGPFVGIGWSGNGIVPTVGFGLQYNLIKF